MTVGSDMSTQLVTSAGTNVHGCDTSECMTIDGAPLSRSNPKPCNALYPIIQMLLAKSKGLYSCRSAPRCAYMGTVHDCIVRIERLAMLRYSPSIQICLIDEHLQMLSGFSGHWSALYGVYSCIKAGAHSRD